MKDKIYQHTFDENGYKCEYEENGEWKTIDFDFDMPIAGRIDRGANWLWKNERKSLISRLTCFFKGHIFVTDSCVRCGKSLMNNVKCGKFKKYQKKGAK